MSRKYSNVFDLASSVFEKARISHVLIGGFAVNYYQVSRQTADVDFLIAVDSCDKVLPLLKKEGYQVAHRSEIFVRLTNNKYPLMDIDLLLVKPDTLTGMIKAGTEITISGRRFIIPSLNHLIALKLHSIKQDAAHREYKDLLDIIELMKVNHLDATADHFKSLCLTYASEDVYQRIIGLLS